VRCQSVRRERAALDGWIGGDRGPVLPMASSSSGDGDGVTATRARPPPLRTPTSAGGEEPPARTPIDSCRRRCLDRRVTALSTIRMTPPALLFVLKTAEDNPQTLPAPPVQYPGHRQYVWPGVHEARLWGVLRRAHSRSEHRTPYGGWRVDKRITCDVALALGVAKDPL